MYPVSIVKAVDHTKREPYVTIDDVIRLVEELVERLGRLGEYSHPLAVRKGVREHSMTKDESRILKSGSKTYFFDIKSTKEGKPYLVITESRFMGEGKERERTSIAIFPEQAQEFLVALQEIVPKLG